MTYFAEVVLPSSELPKKSSYNIAEVLELLGISRTTLYRKVAKGEIVLSKDKRIYYKELENYFSECDLEAAERNNKLQHYKYSS